MMYVVIDCLNYQDNGEFDAKRETKASILPQKVMIEAKGLQS